MPELTRTLPVLLEREEAFGGIWEHLEAELGWARLLLRRHQSQKSLEPAATHPLNGAIAEQRRWIDARLEADAPQGVALPFVEWCAEYGVQELASRVIMLHLLIECDATFADELVRTWSRYPSPRAPLGFVFQLLGIGLEGATLLRVGALGEWSSLRRLGMVSLEGGWGLDAVLRLSPVLVDHLLALAPPIATPMSAGLDALDLDDVTVQRLHDALHQGGPTFKVALVGPCALTAHRVADALASDLARPLMKLPLPDRADRVEGLRRGLLAAALGRAVVLLEAPRARRGGSESGERGWAELVPWELVDAIPVPVVIALSTMEPRMRQQMPRLHEVLVPVPDAAGRRQAWLRHWPTRVPALAAQDLTMVVAQHAVTEGDIHAACALLDRRSRRRRAVPTARQVSALVMEVQEPDFQGFARVVHSHFGWSDLVLADEVMEELQELIAYVRHRDVLLEQWGLGKILPYGRGTSCLFAGPPGTGKTMVANIIAAELGVPMFKIDLSQVVDKYIGETEKRLAHIFDEAAETGAMLLFDEADSMFTRRTAVKSSVDRYANLEVNYLLQRIETFDGLVLLTTNFEQSLDDALRRRLRFVIRFPIPEASEREVLWGTFLVPELPRAADVDCVTLGELYELTGAHIKNAVVRAAARAAGEGQRALNQEDLQHAALAECRALGQLIRTDASP